jgi:hypothetical protein
MAEKVFMDEVVWFEVSVCVILGGEDRYDPLFRTLHGFVNTAGMGSWHC